MNKQEVIDYVMSTPHNVNRTILSQSLDEIGTQADWNQNDPTKPDYVKNRPFWTDDPKELFDGTVSFIHQGGNDTTWTNVAYGEYIVEGQVYIVTWDGVVYECVGINLDGDPFIGNPAIWWVEEYANQDNGMPFCIYTENDNLSVGMLNPEVDISVNVRVIAEGENHKIPEKYLPDGIGGAGNVMVIYLNEGDPENQVYPEGLYDTIDRMMKNNFFDTVIMAIGHGEGDYDIYFYSAVHIYKEGDNYVLQLKADSRKIFIYVRPDNSGWMG